MPNNALILTLLVISSSVSGCLLDPDSENPIPSDSENPISSIHNETINVTVQDHGDSITTGVNDNLLTMNLDSADANISTGSNLGIELEDINGNMHKLAGDILIGSQSGTDDSWWEIGETITLIENGVDITGGNSANCCTFAVRIIDGTTTHHIGNFTLI